MRYEAYATCADGRDKWAVRLGGLYGSLGYEVRNQVTTFEGEGAETRANAYAESMNECGVDLCREMDNDLASHQRLLQKEKMECDEAKPKLPNPPDYECDKCGACCKGFLVEIKAVDILREPKLKNVAAAFMGGQDETWGISDRWILATPNSPCPMLGKNNECTIYSTRPDVCVAFRPGYSKCQDVRLQLGLPVLKATNAKTAKLDEKKFDLRDVPVWELAEALNKRLDPQPQKEKQ